MIEFNTKEKNYEDFINNIDEVEKLVKQMLINDQKYAKIILPDVDMVVSFDDLTEDWGSIEWLEFAQVEFGPKQVNKFANQIAVSTCDLDEAYTKIVDEYSNEELIDKLVESGKLEWVVTLYKPIGWNSRIDEPIEQDCGEFEIDYEEILTKDDIIEYFKNRLKEERNHSDNVDFEAESGPVIIAGPTFTNKGVK